jgi:hypothetical protein
MNDFNEDKPLPLVKLNLFLKTIEMFVLNKN